jgi:hypothetical protein
MVDGQCVSLVLLFFHGTVLLESPFCSRSEHWTRLLCRLLNLGQSNLQCILTTLPRHPTYFGLSFTLKNYNYFSLIGSLPSLRLCFLTSLYSYL